MKLASVVLCCFTAFFLSTSTSEAQFEGFASKGLVGVGRLSSETIDALGNDSLGGMGSSLWFDLSTWNKIDDATGLRYTGRLFSISDSGFRSPGADYKPRLHKFQFSFAPYYEAGPAGQTHANSVIHLLERNPLYRRRSARYLPNNLPSVGPRRTRASEAEHGSRKSGAHAGWEFLRG